MKFGDIHEINSVLQQIQNEEKNKVVESCGCGCGTKEKCTCGPECSSCDCHSVNEDFQDDRKYQSLEELYSKLVDIEKHIKRLGVMDSAEEWEGKPVTGTGDIHDQLITMSKSVQGLQGAVARALKVVPGEQNPDVQKFNKKAVGEVAKHGTTEYYRELDKGQLNHTKSMLMKSAGQLNVAIEQRYKFSKELMGNGDRAGTGDLQKMLDTLNHMISKWDEETKLYGK